MRTNGRGDAGAWEDVFGARVSGGRFVEMYVDVCEVFAGMYVGESDQTSAKIEVFCALFGEID